MAPEPELSWWKEQVERFDELPPAVTRNYVPRRFSLKETARLRQDVVRGAADGAGAWRLVEDELTGTLVVTATPAQHEEVEQLFRRLEAAEPDQRSALRSYAIRHRDVDGLLLLLDSLLTGTPMPTTGEGGADSQQPVLTAPPSPIGGRPGGSLGELSLAKDPGTNRILAIGPPRLLDELERLATSSTSPTPKSWSRP